VGQRAALGRLARCKARYWAPCADFLPLTTLRVFEAVVRNLSFGKAADDVHITQSAVSHQIRKLETDLGVALFIRKTRAIELTPVGTRYLAAITKVFDLLADSTSDIVHGEQRTVRVGLLSSFATNWLIPRSTCNSTPALGWWTRVPVASTSAFAMGVADGLASMHNC